MSNPAFSRHAAAVLAALNLCFALPACAQQQTPVPTPPAVTPPAPTETPDEPLAIWVPAAPTNFRPANRPTDQPINKVVIHDIEGSALGAVRWFQNPAARVSAHYVMEASTGRLWQQVRERDIGWHAGNREINATSIGIEHEGYAYRPGFYGTVLYEASARLVRSITTRHNIPRDRAHIIAHAEVPSLSNPGRLGGGSGHTDPGPYWDWDYYMALIRNDARLESHSFPAVIRPGEKIEASAVFTNLGDDPWPSHASGRQNLAAQAQGPVYLGTWQTPGYGSVFFHNPGWTSPRVAAPLREGDISPGAATRFVFPLQGPRALGTVTEQFRLLKVPVAPKTPVSFGPTLTATLRVEPWDILKDATEVSGFTAPEWNVKDAGAGRRIAWRKGVRTDTAAAAAPPAQWSVALPISGEWKVYARWTDGPARTAAAAYEVAASDGPRTVVLDQRRGGGTWRLLGRFRFDDPRAIQVRLAPKAGATGVIVADALRFVGPFPATAPPPPGLPKPF